MTGSMKKNEVHIPFYRSIWGGIKNHYNDGWNWIDSAFLILSLVAVAIWARVITIHRAHVDEKDITQLFDIERVDPFYDIATLMTVYGSICSINFTIIFIKVLKYLASWLDKVMMIFRTLENA